MAATDVMMDYSAIFDRITAIVEYFNILDVRQTSIGSGDKPIQYIRNQILLDFEAQAGTFPEVDGIEASFEKLSKAHTLIKRDLIGYCQNILATIGDLLGVSNRRDYNAILKAFAEAMAREEQYLEDRDLNIASNDRVQGPGAVETDGTIKAATIPAANIGSGQLVYSFWQPNELMTVNEISHEEVMICECISANTPSREVFKLSGQQKYKPEEGKTQGSGPGPVLMAGGSSFTNWNFANWTGTPKEADDWDLDVGTWGTEVAQEVTVFLRDTYALNIDVNDTAWRLRQQIPTALKVNTMYAVGVWLAKGEVDSNGTLDISIVNSSNVVQESISIDVTDLTEDTYTFWYFVFNSKGFVESDWKIQFHMSAGGTAAKTLYIDCLQIRELIPHNNIYFGLFAGATDFGVKDNFGFGGAASDVYVGFLVEATGGILQKFFGRMFNRQLPSHASHTISDP